MRSWHDRGRGLRAARGNRGRSIWWLVPLFALVGGALGVADRLDLPTLTGSPIARASSACDIKGNISFTSGERIYHVPGQSYYAETRISPLKGERWFCSEAEARQAGWRRALN